MARQIQPASSICRWLETLQRNKVSAMSDVIQFSWRMQQGTSSADAVVLIAEFEQDPASTATLLNTGTALLAETAALIISGAAGLTYLASQIQNVVCRGRKPGIVIDARHDPLSITEMPDLPGGTVITITAGGEQQTYDACVVAFDLAGVIASLRSSG